jgi:hypothetical protein
MRSGDYRAISSEGLTISRMTSDISRRFSKVERRRYSLRLRDQPAVSSGKEFESRGVWQAREVQAAASI